MRSPKVDKNGMKQGAWSAEEDQKLIDYINRYRIWNWGYVAKFSGLSRNGKSCRLRWVNYLSPHIKRGSITEEEEKIIVDMYAEIGSRWSTIAKRLPGRTDNEIKNYWYTRLKKRSNENPTQRTVPHTVKIPTVEPSVKNSDESYSISLTASASEASNSPAFINILTSATSSEASNSQASINLPMNPYVAVDESSDSSTGYARGPDDVQEINKASTDHNSLLQTIGDFDDFWTDPYFTGNMYTENDQQEAYVQEWYQEPLCSYGLFVDENWLNDYLPDAARMVGSEMPDIYIPQE